MELHQIESFLDNPNPQSRMKAITELRNYEPHLVVPLLKRRMYDEKFVVRSFVAMGLGYKQTDEGFRLLIDLIEHDNDHNVRAEAANSLAKYGSEAIPHLVELFRKDPDWLVRYSIFAAIDFTGRPEILLELCTLGIEENHPVVRQAAIASLEQLATTNQASAALDILLSLVNSEHGLIRAQVAKILRRFDDPRAQSALTELRQDSDHRVIAAILEDLI